jgi:hypothetical protein
MTAATPPPAESVNDQFGGQTSGADGDADLGSASDGAPSGQHQASFSAAATAAVGPVAVVRNTSQLRERRVPRVHLWREKGPLSGPRPLLLVRLGFPVSDLTRGCRREPFQHTSDLHGLPFPFAGRGWDTAFIQRLRDASQRRYAGRLHGLDDRPEVGGVSACALGSALPAGGAGFWSLTLYNEHHLFHSRWAEPDVRRGEMYPYPLR